MIKYIKIMVTVFTLLISCSVTNIFASDTNDVIEEKIDISEILLMKLERKTLNCCLIR